MASSGSPIACTLDIGNFRERLAQIAALNRDALRGYERDGLVLRLRYGAAAGDRVREMVEREQACCGFLAFDLREVGNELWPRSRRLKRPEAPPKRCLDQLRLGPVTAERVPRTLPLHALPGAAACATGCELPLALPAVALASTGAHAGLARPRMPGRQLSRRSPLPPHGCGFGGKTPDRTPGPRH